jgi:uncharacterized protein YkwD
MLALGALCSIGAVALDHMAAPGEPQAVEPAPERSAQFASTADLSNAVPTVVTQSPPHGDAAVSAAPAAFATVAALAATPTAAPAPAETVIPVVPLTSGVVAPSEPPESPAKAQALLDLLNAARVREGLPALERDATLDDVALARARNLVANGYFDHYAPDGESAFSELAARGVRYRLAGENLARNNYPDARTVNAAFDGLMASPGHRANILEERFTRVGAAAVQSGRMWIYVTVFMD